MKKREKKSERKENVRNDCFNEISKTKESVKKEKESEKETSEENVQPQGGIFLLTDIQICLLILLHFRFVKFHPWAGSNFITFLMRDVSY